MVNPAYDGKPIPMFYCGDDAEAKPTAATLARIIGFGSHRCGTAFKRTSA
jgi:predicted dinucleotide-binding enzyme